jgi:hypothetical protein
MLHTDAFTGMTYNLVLPWLTSLAKQWDYASGLDLIQMTLNINQMPELILDREPNLFGDLLHRRWNW